MTLDAELGQHFPSVPETRDPMVSHSEMPIAKSTKGVTFLVKTKASVEQSKQSLGGNLRVQYYESMKCCLVCRDESLIRCVPFSLITSFFAIDEIVCLSLPPKKCRMSNFRIRRTLIKLSFSPMSPP